MAKQTRIQVAAPEAGIIFDIGHEHTPWQSYSNSFKALGRGRYVWGNGKATRGTIRTRHLSPTLRGKQVIKVDKRRRHAAMEAR